MKDQVKKIVVLNNDLSTKPDVIRSVERALSDVGHGVFRSVQLIHRDPPLLGTENFYRGISESVQAGDIAFIHGDDDIMSSGSLEKRARILDSQDKAFLITKSSSGVYFFLDDKNIYVNPAKGAANISERGSGIGEYRIAVIEDLLEYSIPFVSAYGYKIGDGFWNCFQEAYRWADALPLEPRIKYPFLPFYMGLSAWKNGQLMVCPENMLMRGQLLRSRGAMPPKVVTEYANTGIILLTGLAVLNNAELSAIPELNELRQSFRKNASEYIVSAFYKRDGVSLGKLLELIKLADFRLNSASMIFRAAQGNGKRLIGETMGLSNFRNRVRGWGVRTAPVDFWLKWSECIY